MENIGLTFQQLQFILLEGIDARKPTINAEELRNCIAKAIEENNKKVLADIKELLLDHNNSQHK